VCLAGYDGFESLLKDIYQHKQLFILQLGMESGSSGLYKQTQRVIKWRCS
jgi:hypothetical protein